MTRRTLIFPKDMVRAAGAVVWRPAPGRTVLVGQPVAPSDLEVLLVHRPRYRDWSWPKGKAESGETNPAAAVREVEEETGQVVALGAPLLTQRYRLGSGQLKEVYYWTGTLLKSGPGVSARVPVAPASRKEIDLVQWVSPNRARTMLTRRGDRRLLTELINRAGRGELVTSTTVLLRHAQAVERARWHGCEADRPLTRQGGAQAVDLIPILASFGVQAVHSSPWLRCTQTVLPYAAVGDTRFHLDGFLTEDAVDSDPAPSSALVERLLCKKRGSRAVSLHRPGYPALLAPVLDLAPRRLHASISAPRRNLAKAEMLVLHVAHLPTPRILSAERHRPFS